VLLVAVGPTAAVYKLLLMGIRMPETC